ncbi:MAG: hypothetical protein ABIC95_05455 [archaeon]
MSVIHVCNCCGANIQEGDFSGACPICRRGDATFEKIDQPDPSDDDKAYTDKYEDVVKELEKYTEGCEPISPKEFED